LGQLRHKPAAGRLVELLKADRPEAFVAAAWALRQLAVSDTLPAVLEYVRIEHEELAGNSQKPPFPARKGVPREAIESQLSQLGQFLGKSRYGPADRILREVFPRYSGE